MGHTMADSKGHRAKFSKQHNKPITLKQFSELPAAWGPPMGAAQSPTDHPIHNLASRDSVPLGQSGEALMAPEEGGLSEGSLGKSRGGGTTQGSY